jgi:hypothetical protein
MFSPIRFSFVATAVFGTLLAPLSAFAIPYGSNTIYKASENGKTIVVFSGTAGSKIQVGLGDVPKVTARIAGACGEVKISPPSSGSFTGLKVDGTTVDAASLSTQTLPSCTNGSFSEPRSANFKTPNNDIVIVGKTPGSATSVELPQPTTKTVSINACGFGVLRPAKDQTLPNSLNANSTSYTLSSMTDASKPPICRTANGVSTGYIPSTWP